MHLRLTSPQQVFTGKRPSYCVPPFPKKQIHSVGAQALAGSTLKAELKVGTPLATTYYPFICAQPGNKNKEKNPEKPRNPNFFKL